MSNRPINDKEALADLLRPQEGMKAAKELLGADKIYLEAQTYAREFYEKQGLYVLQ